MSTLKFICLEVTYDCILDKEETYNLVKKLAQKGAKNSAPPSVYVANYNTKTIALLIYTKPVDWRNLNKLDINDTLRARFKKIHKKEINSAIENLRTLDPDTYPGNFILNFNPEEDNTSINENISTVRENGLNGLPF